MFVISFLAVSQRTFICFGNEKAAINFKEFFFSFSLVKRKKSTQNYAYVMYIPHTYLANCASLESSFFFFESVSFASCSSVVQLIKLNGLKHVHIINVIHVHCIEHEVHIQVVPNGIVLSPGPVL